MCVVAISPKGTNKYSDFFLAALRESARTNNQGFGYGFKRAKTKVVFYAKGFPDINTMIDHIKDHKIKDEDELVVHCRTRSAGGVMDTNSHPFEINYKEPDKAVPTDNGNRTTLNPLLFHNGTFLKFSDTKSQLSDSYHFSNNFMKIEGIWDLLKEDKDSFLTTFKSVIGINRVAILSREADVITFGEFFEDQGYKFSNTQYKPSKYAGNSYQQNQMVLHKNDAIDLSKRVEGVRMNTKDIKITKDNFKDFVFKSTCRSVVGGTKIEAEEYYVVKKFQPEVNSILLELNGTKGSYAFITNEVFNSIFIIIPKPENKSKYVDYLKLVSTVHATKSSIKKIYNKALAVFNRKRDIPKSINLKIKDKNLYVDYEAVLLFLNDYKHLCGNSFQLKSMVDACAPIDANIMQEVLNEPVTSCEC